MSCFLFSTAAGRKPLPHHLCSLPLNMAHSATPPLGGDQMSHILHIDPLELYIFYHLIVLFWSQRLQFVQYAAGIAFPYI